MENITKYTRVSEHFTKGLKIIRKNKYSTMKTTFLHARRCFIIKRAHFTILKPKHTGLSIKYCVT